MILSTLLTQLVPVSLPEFDVRDVCGTEPVCREREASALSRLHDSWTGFPIAARHNCAGKVETGEVTRYSRLEACLIIQQVMMPEAESDSGTVSARIELRPVAATRSSDAN